MNVRILVLSPFRYIYGSKNQYLGTGESFDLNQKDGAERQELKNLLSPACEYSRWVHIERSQIDVVLLAEVDAETKGVPLPEANEISNISLETPETDFTAPVQEPEENPFLTPEIHAAAEAAVIAEAVTASAIETEAPEAEAVVDPAAQKQARAAALEDLHWKKVEKIAASLGITYDNKDQAIADILAIEFP